MVVNYKCVICGKEVAGVLVERKIRCPYCSSKVLMKETNRILEPIIAR